MSGGSCCSEKIVARISVVAEITVAVEKAL
jgi:hypothetical protein